MKIKKEHYNKLKEAVAGIDKIAIQKHVEEVKEKGGYNDLETRIAWDILHACKLNDFIIKELYPYISDNHINTAIKNIVKELKLVY